MLSVWTLVAFGIVKPVEWYRGLGGVWHKFSEGIPSGNADAFSLRLLEQTASMSVAPPSFRNGQSVTVSWQGVPNPTAADFIGMYFPTTAQDNEFYDFVFANTSPTYAQGHGSVTFTLLNLRGAYQFRYVGNATQQAHVVATSEAVPPANVNEPTHGHLALTGDPTQMRVMWVTNSDAYVPLVRYGTQPSQWLQVAGTTSTYTADEMCGAIANQTGHGMFMDPGQIHDVLLKNLYPNTKYYYAFGNNLEGWSPVYTFRTQPRAPLQTRFIVYGDQDITPSPAAMGTAERVQQHIESPEGLDFVLHIGDLSYAYGVAIVWEKWFNLIQPAATRVPYMVGIGNHEYDYVEGGEHDQSGGNVQGHSFQPSWGNYLDDSGGECAVPPFHRFHMPDNGHSLFWYSFNQGPVHIVMMSTEHNFTTGAPQYQWLQADLAAVNRSVTPWVVFAGHRPMYCSEDYEGDYNVTLGMQRSFEDLLLKFGVDLAVWGHYHSYERTCPVYKNECVTGAPVHVVVGMAGADLDDEDYKKVPWSVFHDQQYGYSIITANATGLHFEYRHNADDKLADDFWLWR